MTLARDLINTPSNDMGPAELEAAARALAKRHGAKIDVTDGDDAGEGLSAHPRRRHGLAARAAADRHDLGQCDATRRSRWSARACASTPAGSTSSPTAGMLNMKKDMGGAATALALAHMIMARKLNVRLRVLIPAVENSISGASFRPRDIYPSRKGITVEIGNTDAEGRLVLADALALADEEKPELIVDFATLTGAARVALGPELPPFFTDDDALAAELMRACAQAENDPVWRLPLWRPYEAMLEFESRRHQQCRPAATAARSPPRCSCASSSTRQGLAASRHLRLDACGQARPAGRRRMPDGARALRDAVERYGMSDGESRPAPQSLPARPRRRGICAARSRRRGSSKARLRSDRADRRRAARAVARRRARHAGAATASASRSTSSNDEGWAWGQLESDDYVGWLPANALVPPRESRRRTR